jgi:ATP-binding cassette, subfamily B, bacterial
MAMFVGGGPGGFHRMIYQEMDTATPPISASLIRRVTAYGWPYRYGIALMFASMLAGSALALVPPLILRELIDHALPNRDFGRLNLLAVAMVAVPLFSGLAGVLQRFLSVRIGEGIIYDLRRALYNHMQRMSLRFFTSTKTGELMSRLNNDVVGAQQAVTSTLTSIASNVISLVATLAIMIALEWRLTLISIAILPLFILPARSVAGIMRRTAREQLERNAEMNALMNETLNVSGALLVKLFGRAKLETERFARRASAVRDLGIKQALIGRWLFFALGMAGAIGSALVFWVGGQLVLHGEFSIGTIVAFAAYLGQLYGPISALANARVDFATSMVSFERVFEVLDLPVEIDQRPEAVPLADVAGRVTFEDVWFAYNADEDGQAGRATLRPVERRNRISERALSEGDDLIRGTGEIPTNGASAPSQARFWAVQGVSFEVLPGQVAALVGASGAGKTTITYLLPRLYDTTKGRILIDGHNLRDVTLQSLSEQIGTVTQESYLFHDTIRANLLYAKPSASQSEIEAAARAANIDEFIRGLPKGYETIVGERGYRLSGGEKQRVAIARVILKDPRILVLDEATSHLDSHSEALIQAALETVMHGRTSVVIAHRLSTILSADVILVMDRGQLVERGSHAELLGQEGFYARLYRTQFRTEGSVSVVG